MCLFTQQNTLNNGILENIYDLGMNQLAKFLVGAVAVGFLMAVIILPIYLLSLFSC